MKQVFALIALLLCTALTATVYMRVVPSKDCFQAGEYVEFDIGYYNMSVQAVDFTLYCAGYGYSIDGVNVPSIVIPVILDVHLEPWEFGEVIHIYHPDFLSPGVHSIQGISAGAPEIDSIPSDILVYTDWSSDIHLSTNEISFLEPEDFDPGQPVVLTNLVDFSVSIDSLRVYGLLGSDGGYAWIDGQYTEPYVLPALGEVTVWTNFALLLRQDREVVIDTLRIYTELGAIDVLIHLDRSLSVDDGNLDSPGGVTLRLGPNPVRSETRVEFDLPQAGCCTLAIFDVRGARVRTLSAGYREKGHHSVVWDGRDEHGRFLSGGVYLFRMSGFGDPAVKKVILLR